MIIRELELTNIRSHAHSTLRFPEGRTLLEGDIGSGKSSVLMAIEFAFFGLGSDSGSSVLKLGRDAGEVRMVFDVDGNEYEVTRKLQRKAGRAQQLDGLLRTPEGTLNLSPSELKEKILEILEFNEAPDPKAQSWIYRYAVYTPQEEMKSILALVPDQRLQILRRAFRVEDYKTAASNAEEAARHVKVEAVRFDVVSEGVQELRGQIAGLNQEEGRLKIERTEVSARAAGAEEQLGAMKAEREELRKKELGLQGARTEKDHYELLRTQAALDVADVEQDVMELRAELKKVESTLEKESVGKAPTAKELPELKRKERVLEGRVRKLTGLKAAIESKLSDYESIVKNGVCPVCDRPAEAHDFEEKRSKKENEREHIADGLVAVEEELALLRKTKEATDRYVHRKKEVALRKTERSRLKAQITRKETEWRKFEKRAAFAKENLNQLGKTIEELEEVVREREAKERKIDQAEEALRKAREDLARSEDRIESVRRRLEEIVAEIQRKEDAIKKSRRLKERDIWLTDYFVPTVKLIEKSVLATINQEFDTLFKRWFAMLVSDTDKEVGVDEDFTPIVSQAGYEQDVRYLSGGERTSVALAYRLALNILAQRVSAGMKSNLLILDEPTDGFSKEQLGNLREVLDEVGCPQVLIVSHDKELESFADQIFRVDKTGSESTIRVP